MKNHFTKWWIIYLGALLSIGILSIGIFEVEWFPAEEYISAAAFFMLIATAVLQNKELSNQREDVKLNREELEFQRKELENQTKEFKKTNEHNKENLEITQFYEALTLREKMYIDIIQDKTAVFSDFQTIMHVVHHFRTNNAESNIEKDPKTEKDFNQIQQFNEYVKGKVLRELEVSVVKKYDSDETEILKDSYQKLVNENNLLELLDIEIPQMLRKLHTYNKIIENMVYEKSESESVFPVARFKELLRDITKIPGKRYSRSELYEKIITNDERILTEIIENKLDFKDIIS